MQVRIISFMVLSFLALLSTGAQAEEAMAANQYTLAEDFQTGFGVYRSGTPSQASLMAMCKNGVRRIIVLNGSGDSHEVKWIAEAKANNEDWIRNCPDIEVVYDIKQKVNNPLSADFLEKFDGWVRDTKIEGSKIAFRCTHGSHRTGRLAAYYRMKYDGWDWTKAHDEMISKMEKGIYKLYKKKMLESQIHALSDYIQGKYVAQDGGGANCPVYSKKMKKKAKKGRVCVRATGDT